MLCCGTPACPQSGPCPCLPDLPLTPPSPACPRSVLQDANPGVGIGDVEQLFQEEFGMPLKALFASFDAVPLAAASLAQVHKAQTLDGEVGV
jgi:predicted unusual protein kinase regulating ubiquinone biosynthesis (AarF/ABC1/UbiB family)